MTIRAGVQIQEALSVEHPTNWHRWNLSPGLEVTSQVYLLYGILCSKQYMHERTLMPKKNWVSFTSLQKKYLYSYLKLIISIACIKKTRLWRLRDWGYGTRGRRGPWSWYIRDYHRRARRLREARASSQPRAATGATSRGRTLRRRPTLRHQRWTLHITIHQIKRRPTT